jgi:hypothetical protein
MDPELGMGIEFLPRTSQRREQLQTLIQQITASPDTVCEVLVEPEGIDWDQTANQSSPANPQSPQAEPTDPLLELFRTGPSLTKGQFLIELEKYQLVVSPADVSELNLTEPVAYQRREPRIAVDLPVQVRAQDQESSSLTTHLIDVSHRGARVGGLAFHLKPGEVVNLVSDGCDARFLVIWVGQPGTPQEGQIGLQSLATD